MPKGSEQRQLNTQQIEAHLRSAVDALIPDVLDRVDLSVPQEKAPGEEVHSQALIRRLERRMRCLTAAAAACLCLVLMGGGAFHYHVVNGRVESVIGIDVNPSVELSINRRERVLEARALNEEAELLMDGMDLKGVDLNVAVNAVVGSMVTHGYLDDLDNAILVTVSNDSVRKARELRASVVGDIEQTLEENQVQAVVYDQQVIEDETIQQLAEEYGISYGKAYFLKELIDQNETLTMTDMEELSSMTMEEIARRIAEDSYALGEMADRVQESQPETALSREETSAAETETEVAEETSQESQPETTPSETSAPETSEPETSAETSAEETQTEEPDEVEEGLIEIDYVDYEDDHVYVYFMDPVEWKNPTVSVKDAEGNSYAAMVIDTSRTDCTILAEGLEGGQEYIFVLGGLRPKNGDTATTVEGYFEKPEIAGQADEEYLDQDGNPVADDEDEETKEEKEDPGEKDRSEDKEDSKGEAPSVGTESSGGEQIPEGEQSPDEGKSSDGEISDGEDVHEKNGSPEGEEGGPETVGNGTEKQERIFTGGSEKKEAEGQPADAGAGEAPAPEEE